LSVPITIPEIVVVDTKSTTKEQVTKELAEKLEKVSRLKNVKKYLKAVAAREEHFPTGIEGGIAIPHAQSEYVLTPSVAVATSKAGIDFGADDGPSHLIFLIAAPGGGDSAHLEILGSLARKVMQDEFREELLAQTEGAAIAEIVTREVQN
jgi:fructose-specific phosphotransferase system IIA component